MRIAGEFKGFRVNEILIVSDGNVTLVIWVCKGFFFGRCGDGLETFVQKCNALSFRTYYSRPHKVGNRIKAK